MWNKLPVLILVVAATAVGIWFFRVIQPFVLPLIFACVLAVLFWPVYRQVRRLCFNCRRIAAMLTTVLIVMVVMLPVAGGLTLATMQLVQMTNDVSRSIDIDAAQEIIDGKSLDEAPNDSPVIRRIQELRSRFTQEQVRQIRQAVSSALGFAVQSTYQRTIDLVANVVAFVVGSVIMVLGLYHFLAEKETILAEVERLSPLEEQDQRTLHDSFVRACRGILVGNVLAAFLQAALNGIGFAVLGLEAAWLLAFLTFFTSFVPFVGAGAVWIAVSIYLVFQGRIVEAAALSVYGMLIVSTVDNLIRAYALHDTARIHPLIALISILGGIQLVGLWGVIVGPVTAAFFYALLGILHKKLTQARQQERALILPHYFPTGDEVGEEAA